MRLDILSISGKSRINEGTIFCRGFLRIIIHFQMNFFLKKSCQTLCFLSATLTLKSPAKTGRQTDSQDRVLITIYFQTSFSALKKNAMNKMLYLVQFCIRQKVNFYHDYAEAVSKFARTNISNKWVHTLTSLTCAIFIWMFGVTLAVTLVSRWRMDPAPARSIHGRLRAFVSLWKIATPPFGTMSRLNLTIQFK